MLNIECQILNVKYWILNIEYWIFHMPRVPRLPRVLRVVRPVAKPWGRLESHRDMSEETRFLNKPRFCCVACSAVIVSSKQPSLVQLQLVSRNKGVARRNGQQVVQWKGRQGFVSRSLYTLLVFRTCLISSLLHSAVNVRIGTREDRQLLTGTHTVRLHCFTAIRTYHLLLPGS